MWGAERTALEGLLRRVPKPESDAEMEIASVYYFGCPTHLRDLYLFHHSGRFEVEEDFDSYDPFDGEYDAHHIFFDWATGTRYCGGTARSVYGQFRCGHRQARRLNRWILSRRQGDSSSVREAFAKVSRAENGRGVNTLNRCRGVLIDGRVDGASDSFSRDEVPA